MEKVLFINAVEILELFGDHNIPTAIAYSDDEGPVIGYDAFTRAASTGAINQHFKIELGKIAPGSPKTSRAKFIGGDGARRTAYEITSDFFGSLFRAVGSSLADRSLKPAKQVLISEPLSFYAADSSDWLPQYRANIRRLLSSQFDSIEFMPEPFAVYQYYRYGLKYPLLQDPMKIYALVIDFGGGTFDVSVVETTQFGDISRKGKHARPIAAHSAEFGGVDVTRMLAAKLVDKLELSDEERKAATKCIRNHHRWKRGEIDIRDLNDANRIFIRWFDRFLTVVERKKIELSKSLIDWRLNSKTLNVVSVDMPDNPFTEVPREVSIRLSEIEFRSLFVKEIWARHLKPTIRSALNIAKDEMRHNQIHVALMSGGSSNIRWLEELLSTEFGDLLAHGDIVSLREDYQQVVAKGLAIECARRGYEEDSEFSDVIYNPLFLVLNPDGKGEERKRFRLLTGPKEILQPDQPAELLKSATSPIQDSTTRMRWKVRLRHPPKQFLRYYFTRDPADVSDLEARYNIVQTEIPTARGTTFESQLKVDLELRPDGTTVPTFIYKTGKDQTILHKETGFPFFLDWVETGDALRHEAFMGIDFGTSTSAVSFVDWPHVQLIQRRQREKRWRNLNDLLDLPFPVAASIKRFISSRDQDTVAGLEAFESCLAFIVAILHSEMAKPPNVLNSGYKRSAGPLKSTLYQLTQQKKKGPIGSSLSKTIDATAWEALDHAVDCLNAQKHHKMAGSSYRANEILEFMGNLLLQALHGFEFGYFENVQRIGFAADHEGTFRCAHGSVPFHRKIQYRGAHSFSEQQAFLINSEHGTGLSMSPFYYFSHVDRGVNFSTKCYVYDQLTRDGVYEFKMCDGNQTERFEPTSELGSMVIQMLDNSSCNRLVDGLVLNKSS